MTLFTFILLVSIGVGGGIAVGTAFVAFLTLLDIVPRLAQITKTYSLIQKYEYAIIIGCIIFTLIDFRDYIIHSTDLINLPLGLVMGLFVGMIAAALTEVLNVLPIIAKRLNMQEHLVFLLMAMVLGKIVGSLFQWFIF